MRHLRNQRLGLPCARSFSAAESIVIVPCAQQASHIVHERALHPLDVDTATKSHIGASSCIYVQHVPWEPRSPPSSKRLVLTVYKRDHDGHIRRPPPMSPDRRHGLPRACQPFLVRPPGRAGGLFFPVPGPGPTLIPLPAAPSMEKLFLGGNNSASCLPAGRAPSRCTARAPPAANVDRWPCHGRRRCCRRRYRRGYHVD